MAINTINTFDRRIVEIEQIPKAIIGLCGEITSENAHIIPAKILAGYSQFLSCSICFDSTQFYQNHPMYYSAYRVNRDSITSFSNNRCYYYIWDPKYAIYTNNSDGYWLKTGSAPNIIASYCFRLKGADQRPFGILKLDISMKSLTDFIHDFHFFKSGILMIIDKSGNFIAHPDENSLNTSNITTYRRIRKVVDDRIYKDFMHGKTGYGIFQQGDEDFFIFYTPTPKIDWRIGVMCPYKEILMTSYTFMFLLFLNLSIGLLFLLWSSIRIIYTLSYPLKKFSASVRQITDGNFDTPLPEASSTKEMHELHDSFRFMQQNLNHYVAELKKNIAFNERMNAEMILAQRLQKRFIPKSPLYLPSIELFAELKQSYEVGGDLYDYFFIQEKLFFVIGDVSGKGTPAALYMASIMKLFRYVTTRNESPCEVCNIINTYMCENDDLDDDMYVTMFIGVLDITSGEMTYTNAGHTSPYILKDKDNISPLNSYPDVPIGIISDHEFQNSLYKLDPGDLLLLYTDGVTDAEDAEAHFYGSARFENGIKQVAGNRPQVVIETIMKNIKEYIGKASQTDDLTLLAILYKDSSK